MAAAVVAWPFLFEKQTGERLFPSLDTVSGSAQRSVRYGDDSIGAMRVGCRSQERRDGVE